MNSFVCIDTKVDAGSRGGVGARHCEVGTKMPVQDARRKGT
jgi:hypothetical protein